MMRLANNVPQGGSGKAGDRRRTAYALFICVGILTAGCGRRAADGKTDTPEPSQGRSVAIDYRRADAEALRAAEKLGPEAAAAIAALIRGLEGNRRLPAGSDTRKAGGADGGTVTQAPPVAVLARSVVDSINVLKGIDGSEAAVEPLVGTLVAAMHHGDVSIRFLAVSPLPYFAPLNQNVTPTLIEALDDIHPRMRSMAADGLRQIGPGAEAAVPALIKLLRDDDKDVRGTAPRALGAIGPKANAAIPALDDALDDDDKWVRFFAAEALWRIDRQNKVIELLIALVEDRSEKPHLRRLATRLLGETGSSGKAAIPALTAAAEEGSAHFREEATMALKKIRGDDESVRP